MYLVCRTIGLSDYWIVGLSGCRIIGLTPYKLPTYLKNTSNNKNTGFKS